MKAIVQDTEVLKSLAPLEIAAYLRGQHWRQVEWIGRKGTVWASTLEGGGEVEALLPTDRTLRDYPDRMRDLLDLLAKVEDRSQLEILEDISTSTEDVIRLRLVSPAIESGRISIDSGVRVFEGAYDLVFAAACAVIQPRPVYPTRKPQQAVDYMKKVKLGQTERGSYVLTVHSAVPPQLQAQNQQGLFELEEPFERQVMLKLASALGAVQVAAEKAGTMGDLQPFNEAVPFGVSSNLCDAISKLVSASEAKTLTVGFSWATIRPTSAEITRKVVIDADVVPVLQEAARIFRASTPIDNFEILGWVVKLESEDASKSGRVTVATEIDGRIRKVQVDLEGEDYEGAITAHRDRQAVRLIGKLVKDNRNYVLHNPSSFTLESEEIEVGA